MGDSSGGGPVSAPYVVGQAVTAMVGLPAGVVVGGATPPGGADNKAAALAVVEIKAAAAAEGVGVTPRLVRRLVTERRIGFVRVGQVHPLAAIGP